MSKTGSSRLKRTETVLNQVVVGVVAVASHLRDPPFEKGLKLFRYRAVILRSL